MNNTVRRVLLVIFAIPCLYALALFVPFLNYLPLVSIVLVFSFGSAIELALLIDSSSGKQRLVTAGLTSLIPGILVWLSGMIYDHPVLLSYLAVFGLSIAAVFFIKSLFIAFPKSKIPGKEEALSSLCSSLLFTAYPAAFAAAIISMLSVERGGLIVIWFSLVCFSNDSLAWLVGMTLGRRRGIFTVSAKKSLEGLIAGMAGSVGFSLLGPVIFPDLVPARWIVLSLLGLLCGFTVVLGDLFESALKRSAGIKDSGNIIPGRGGFLDSFDSVAFMAPVFLLFIHLLGIL